MNKKFGKVDAKQFFNFATCQGISIIRRHWLVQLSQDFQFQDAGRMYLCNIVEERKNENNLFAS